MIILIPFSSLLFCPVLVQAGNLALESVDACGGFCDVLLVCEVELSELEALGWRRELSGRVGEMGRCSRGRRLSPGERRESSRGPCGYTTGHVVTGWGGA